MRMRRKKDSPSLSPGQVKIGAGADAFYASLMKQFVQSGRTHPRYYSTFIKAVEGVNHLLLHRSQPSGLAFLAELDVPTPSF